MTDTAQGDEIEGLRAQMRQLIAALDRAYGTPCEQIRHAEEVASLRERLAKAEGERDEAQADLSKLMDPELKHLRVEDGGIDLALTGPIVQHIGQVICEHFRASGAENYIEMTYTAKTEPFETYVWTIQKRVGRNSPHDLRTKAEARTLLAEGKLAEAKGRVERVGETVMALKRAVAAVTSATSVYLPPDGISKDELISRVLEATDNPEINAVMIGGQDAAS